MTNLGYALLGLLARQPFTGYDLAQYMKMPVSLFWHARHNQIYPELASLEAAGLVTFVKVAQQERPDKKIYSITEEGRTILRQWLTEAPALAPTKDELLLKAFNLWLLEPAQGITLFQKEAQRHLDNLAAYEATLKEGLEKLGPEEKTVNSPGFGSYLTLHWAIRYEREYADWCLWVVEQLKQPPSL